MIQSKITTHGVGSAPIRVMIATVFILSLFTYVVLSAARDPSTGTTVSRTREAEQTIPQKCAEFYNDGTGRWAECLGVGPK